MFLAFKEKQRVFLSLSILTNELFYSLMTTETQRPAREDSRAEFRNAKGEWRPPYPATYTPLFVWPPRPFAVIKWVFTYPGFMWPRNLVLLLISTFSYIYTQPALSRCAHFHWDWLAQIYGRNLALMWLVYGGFYFLLYMVKTEGTKGKYDARWPAKNSSLFLFRDQVYDNVFWTCGVAGLIWTLSKR